MPSIPSVGHGAGSRRNWAGPTRGLALAGVLFGVASCQTTATDTAAVPDAAVVPMQTSAAGSYLMARQAYKARDLGIASSHFQTALNEDPKNQPLVRRTFLAELEYGGIPAAIALAERGIKSGGVAPFMYVTLGLQAANAGKWAVARDYFLRMPKSRLNQILRPLLNGWAAVGLKDRDVAMDSFAEVGKLPGFEVLARLHSGHAAQLRHDRDAADRAFQQALSSAGNPPLRLSLAVALYYASTQRLDAAHGVLAHRTPRDHDAVAVADLLQRASTGALVAGLVGSATDGMAEALFDIASASQRERGNNASMIMAQLALYMRPAFPLAQLLVGEILDDRKQHQRALDNYRRVSGPSAYYSMALLRSASSLQDLDRIEEAIALLRDLAEQRPADPTPLMRIGDMQRGEKRWSKAIDSYDRAVARLGTPESGDWSLFYTRGIALERTRNWGRAEADFLKALELAPEQPYVMNYLGYSWTEQGINLEKAAGLIEKAVELRPDDGYIIDSLGWILFRTGRFDEAVPKLERAVQLRPNDPTINDHLGDAYWRVGRQIEAMFQWRRALAMKPEPELVAPLEAKLKQGLPTSRTPGDVGEKTGLERAPDA